ncbi:3-dehydroquinate synthase [Acidithiobacillus thiooxidans]|uniref:3-dehydroquinate synthase n=1 Tax=Acidithiobacillus thiooxidans ATCC 19377 TaxID=637390 RepID=A0A543Q4C1_ACITH|nr:3-dehydroquinate synthase [Acidithiobacillus thiooxidans]MDR7925506.1 3-dehydroquinate synthase [Acidithiobacillus thiooxidans]MDX5934700.1 3-dehydroquinate synthase [Acidithiobacillus thiooxidans]TQN51177.1 3-dehydroquinate synthase [Acidithiobacillus thiooxidans ATCC 19377]
MQSLRVELGQRSYSIHIGSGIIGDTTFFAPVLSKGPVAIITDTNVAPLYLQALQNTLKALNKDSLVITLPAGEESKSLDNIQLIAGHLLSAGYGRDCTLCALGGGVVGDITGFAAAVYQRGVACVQIPTTLLAMVDSSVGGKTGVNHPLGKNMIGAFYQPRTVIVDTDTLDSLPEREFRSGLAEVIKYGLINDPGFFSWLEDNLDAVLARDTEALAKIIKTSCRDKADVVARDELEGGLRAILNFGHTFGHAIEAASGYGHYLHGEAVAIGMVMAADLSRRLDLLRESEQNRIFKLIKAAGLPTLAPRLKTSVYLDFMKVDKKAEGGQIRFILLNSIGNALITGDVPPAAIIQTLQAFMERSA